MYPGCIQVIFLLEDCVRNGEMELSAELVKEAPNVTSDINAVPTNDSFPYQCVPRHTSIEVAKYQDLIICRNVVQMSAQI